MAVLSAAITCASLALADAGIEMYDLVIGTTAVSGEGLALLGCSGFYNFRVPLLFTNTISSRGAPEVCVILFNISPHEAPEVCVTLFDILPCGAPEAQTTIFTVSSHRAFLVLSASFSAVLFKYRTLCGLICDSDFCFVIWFYCWLGIAVWLCRSSI